MNHDAPRQQVVSELLEAYTRSVDCADPDCPCEGNDEAKALVKRVRAVLSSATEEPKNEP